MKHETLVVQRYATSYIDIRCSRSKDEIFHFGGSSVSLHLRSIGANLTALFVSSGSFFVRRSRAHAFMNLVERSELSSERAQQQYK